MSKSALKDLRTLVVASKSDNSKAFREQFIVQLAAASNRSESEVDSEASSYNEDLH